jgi:hypothetical protein
LHQTTTELQEVEKVKEKTSSGMLDCVEEYLAAEDHGNAVACAIKSAIANGNTVLFSEVKDAERAAATDVAAISIEMLVNEGAFSYARSISSEGVILVNEGDQVFCLVSSCQCSRRGDTRLQM